MHAKQKMYYISDNVIPQNIIITVVQFRNKKNDNGRLCTERKTNDKLTNVFRKKLITMCKLTGLRILIKNYKRQACGCNFLNIRRCRLVCYLQLKSDYINKVEDLRSSTFTTFLIIHPYLLKI